jgi:hypothetical protein
MAMVRFSPDKADYANVLDYDREAARYDTALGAGDVTGPAGRLTSPDRVLNHAAERIEELPHHGALAGPQVDRERWPGQGVAAAQGGQMGRGQVSDMDVVPHA